MRWLYTRHCGSLTAVQVRLTDPHGFQLDVTSICGTVSKALEKSRNVA